jgi:hypothetical protein
MGPRFRIKGYSLYFKGKLGKAGSVRKRVLYFKGGLNSLSDINLRLDYRKFIIMTITGVVGGCVSIFF